MLYQAHAGALTIEFANPRHQHEFEAIRANPLPKDWLLIPGVIDTTTNFVEHPRVVARRIEEAVSVVGDRERVIASTDCGFGTFAGREWVAADHRLEEARIPARRRRPRLGPPLGPRRLSDVTSRVRRPRDLTPVPAPRSPRRHPPQRLRSRRLIKGQRGDGHRVL